MKKALFLTLALAIGFAGFAQRVTMKAPELMKGTASMTKVAFGQDVETEVNQFKPMAPAVVTVNRNVDYEEADAILTDYDLQTNNIVANRVYRFDDGSIGVTATFSLSYNTSAPDRGTGYNFFDGEEWGEQPQARIENIKTGWPSYCQYGPNGEIVVAHTGNGVVYTTRENKGEGDWAALKEIPNPEELASLATTLTWARVVTSGPDHNIIHVISASQQQDDEGVYHVHSFYSRSTDGENWTTVFMPLLDEQELDAFSADDYAMAAYGNTVAILLTGSVTNSSWVLKSTDNGETWEKILVWEHPYNGLDWETDPNAVFTDTLFMPEQGSVAVDKDGLVHCVVNSCEILHDSMYYGGYTYWYGGTVDGVFYWNEHMGPIVDHAHEEYIGTDCEAHFAEPNQHHALRLWWPSPDNPGYVTRNLDNSAVGFLPTIDGWSNSNFFHHESYTDHFKSVSCYPSLCIDESGIIAVAWSCPDIDRMDQATSCYYRSIYVSYVEGIGDYYYLEENLCEFDNPAYITHMYDECVNLCAATNTIDKEFVFCYTSDDKPGYSIGTYDAGAAHDIQDNYVYVVKFHPDYQGMSVGDAVNPLNNVEIHPNPVSDNLNITVNAAQSSLMNIAVYNITGQKVMETSATISSGINRPCINVSNLTSGIYFVTVSANGFEETMKFVVK